MNSTCYSPALMESLSRQAERLQPATIVVSLTKALKSPQFQLLSKKKYQMSWSGSDGHTRPCTHSTQRDGDRRQGQANATRAQCAAGMD